MKKVLCVIDVDAAHSDYNYSDDGILHFKNDEEDDNEGFFKAGVFAIMIQKGKVTIIQILLRSSLSQPIGLMDLDHCSLFPRSQQWLLKPK